MMATLRRAGLFLVVLATTCAVRGESHLMRIADVHEDQIVFNYESDLWLASTEGGLARRITNDPGGESWAKFSPDGKSIAFSAQYDGGADVYIMDAQGGRAHTAEPTIRPRTLFSTGGPTGSPSSSVRAGRTRHVEKRSTAYS